MIKPLSQENLAAAQALLRLVFTDAEEASGASHYFALSLKPNQESYFQYWVLDVGGKVIGTTGLYYDKDTPRDLWLGWFCVHPDFRRKGYGTMLLNFSLERARKSSQRLWLWTTDAPDMEGSKAMYERHGFKREAIEQVENSQFHIVKYSLFL